MAEIPPFHRKYREGHDLLDIDTLSWRSLSFLYLVKCILDTRGWESSSGKRPHMAYRFWQVLFSLLGKMMGLEIFFLPWKKWTMLWAHETGVVGASDWTLISRVPRNGSGPGQGAGDTVPALLECTFSSSDDTPSSLQEDIRKYTENSAVLICSLLFNAYYLFFWIGYTYTW